MRAMDVAKKNRIKITEMQMSGLLNELGVVSLEEYAEAARRQEEALAERAEAVLEAAELRREVAHLHAQIQTKEIGYAELRRRLS